jgi:hypothetical protein
LRRSTPSISSRNRWRRNTRGFQRSLCD